MNFGIVQGHLRLNLPKSSVYKQKQKYSKFMLFSIEKQEFTLLVLSAAPGVDVFPSGNCGYVSAQHDTLSDIHIDTTAQQ